MRGGFDAMLHCPIAVAPHEGDALPTPRQVALPRFQPRDSEGCRCDLTAFHRNPWAASNLQGSLGHAQPRLG